MVVVVTVTVSHFVLTIEADTVKANVSQDLGTHFDITVEAGRLVQIAVIDPVFDVHEFDLAV